MHSANFTALSRVVELVLPPLLVLVPPLLAVPVRAGACEQPALITAIMASAASGRSFLLMFSPRLWWLR
jgi:hypothetical protein